MSKLSLPRNEKSATKKTLRRASRSLVTLCAFASLAALGTQSASANTVQYWDADGATTTAVGGTGTWDTTSALWRTSSTTGALGTYTNGTGTNSAYFAGTAGTVTLASGAAITANNLTFLTNGYTIAGNTGATLTLDGTAPTINVGQDFSQTISAVLAGTAGLTKASDDGSTLTLSGVNTYTGATTINGGTIVLDMNAGGSLNSASTLVMGTSNSGNFQLRGANGTASAQTVGSITAGTQATAATVTVTPGTGTGSTATLNATALGRGGAGASINFDVSAANSAVTVTSSTLAGSSTTTLTNGVISTGFVTVTDATGTGFGTVNASNQLVRYTGATALPAASTTSTVNYVTSGPLTFTGTGTRTVNGLQFDTSGGSGSLNLGGLDLSVGNRAVLMTGSGDFTISNGTIDAANATDLFVHQYGTGTLTIGVTIGVTGSANSRIEKTGPGVLALTGVNTNSGLTGLDGGTLRANDGVGLSPNSLFYIQNGVFETGANFTRVLANVAPANGFATTIIQGSSGATGGSIGTGFSAFGAPVTVSLATGTVTGNAVTASVPNAALSWGSGGFNPDIFVLNAVTANNTINFTNPLSLNGLNRTVQVNSADAYPATMSGVVSGAGVFTKAGTGTLIFNNANTYTSATIIGAGTLQLDSNGSSTPRLTATPSITVNTGGMLTMANSVPGTPSTDRVNNAATVTLAGGTLNLGGFSEGAAGTTGIGTLTLTATSTLDFGTPGSSNLIQFAGLGTHTAGTLLQVTDWEGTSGSANGTDRLLFAGTSTAFTSLYGQSDVSFNGVAGYGITSFSGYYEVYGFTAVPEPSTIVGAAFLLGVLGWRERRRFQGLALRRKA